MPTLLADIGGTNVRFALLRPGALEPDPPERLALDAFPGIADAIEAWLAARPGPRPRAAVLAVAGPVLGGRVMLTNRGWLVDGAALAAELGLASVRVVNDFAALAWSLPVLGPGELVPLGGPAEGAAGEAMAVLGPGTGLGVAGCLPPGRVLATEGGHAALAAHDAREAALIEAIRDGLGGGHVSAERGALSGQGIEALHAALGGDPARAAPAIVREGIAGTDPRCTEAMVLFCAMLGGFAGDVALTLGARGGVFIGGGIAPRFPGFLAASGFRARFEAKGRFRDWLGAVPTWLIADPEAAAMRGLAVLARHPAP